MKKTLLGWCLLWALVTITPAEAHKEWVHQYILQEAYKLLEREVGTLPQIRDAIGDERFEPNMSSTTPLKETPQMMNGVWQEDHDDIRWMLGAIDAGFSASSSHFWDADAGDNDMMVVPINVDAYNAWWKAREFVFGTSIASNFELNFVEKGNFLVTEKGGTDHDWIRIYGKTIRYPNLASLYCPAEFTLLGLRFVPDMITYLPRPVEVQGPRYDARDFWFFNIWGRVIHLLQDMSVPAHVHKDMHPCDLNGGDYFELWVGGRLGTWPWECNTFQQTFNGQQWDAETARARGGLFWEALSMEPVDGMRYLFYTMNQLADHFDAPDEDEFVQVSSYGDDNYTGSFPYLAQRLPELPEGDLYITEDYIEAAADELMNTAIRATATALYMMWLSMDPECPLNLYLQNDELRPAVNGTLTTKLQAISEVIVGDDVSPHADVPNGPVFGRDEARVNVTAGEQIILTNGTTLEHGSIMHLSIGPGECGGTSCSELLNITSSSMPVLADADTVNHVTLLVTDSALVDDISIDRVEVADWRMLSVGASATVPADSLDIDTATTASVIESRTIVADTVSIRTESDSTLRTMVGGWIVSVDADEVVDIDRLTYDALLKPRMAASDEAELRALPIPAIEGTMRIEYRVAERGPVRLLLVGLDGVVRSTLRDFPDHAAGRGVAEIATADVPSGRYVVILQTTSTQRSVEIVILH